MSIVQDLADFYTTEAKKYHQTRKKYRPEGELLLQSISKLSARIPKILELGCGGGRFISLLNQQFKKKFSYTWIDISEGLLSYAQEENPDQHFFCTDMLSHLQSCKQESLDLIVACASFQHLPTEKERLVVMKNAYRALNYEGMLIFTNWAFSERFLKTHGKNLYSLWWNLSLHEDILVEEISLSLENPRQELIIGTIIFSDSMNSESWLKCQGSS